MQWGCVLPPAHEAGGLLRLGRPPLRRVEHRRGSCAVDPMIEDAVGGRGPAAESSRALGRCHSDLSGLCSDRARPARLPLQIQLHVGIQTRGCRRLGDLASWPPCVTYMRLAFGTTSGAVTKGMPELHLSVRGVLFVSRLVILGQS
ncbi:hypothetical protein NDU88_006882 [Pleurodeles waltl]|uniref:Uncharacterized protein n=1 Tax=Pleurodeles waltl TaxID=8319 RepID=A0AAV7TZN6_PLEWA|nr:hypothetical protein NDU88_006882 [Pleurodeles waltl]